jgi:hypothetical protein
LPNTNDVLHPQAVAIDKEIALRQAEPSVKDHIGSSVLLQVRLAQIHRIQARVSICKSNIAYAEIAQLMSPQVQSASEGAASTSSSEMVPSPTSAFSEFMPMITSALDRLTTSANQLPANRSDINFHRTMDRQFANDLDEASERVLKMTEKLLTLVELGQAEAKSKGKGKDAKITKATGKTRRKLEEEEDVVDGYKRGVLGVVDGLLEDAVSYILLVFSKGCQLIVKGLLPR